MFGSLTVNRLDAASVWCGVSVMFDVVTTGGGGVMPVWEPSADLPPASTPIMAGEASATGSGVEAAADGTSATGAADGAFFPFISRCDFNTI